MTKPTAIVALLAIAVGALLGFVFTRPRSEAPRPRAAESGGAAPPPVWSPENEPPARAPRAPATGAPDARIAADAAQEAAAKRIRDTATRLATARAATPGAAGSRADALPAGMAAVIGTIVDGAGRPLAGAEVAVPGSKWSATAGADGAFRLGPLTPAATLRIRVSAPGSVEESYELSAPEANVYDVGEIRLSEGATVRGRVRAANGTAAVQAEVKIFARDDPSTPAQTTVTADDGNFELRGLAVGEYALLAESGDEAGTGQATVRGPSEIVEAGEVVLDGRVAGPVGSKVRVRVLDPQGAPAAEATVMAVRADAPPPPATPPDGRTGPDGIATIVVPAGSWVIWADLAGPDSGPGSSAPIAIDGRTPASVEIRVGAGGRVEGHVAASPDVLRGARARLTPAGPGDPRVPPNFAGGMESSLGDGGAFAFAHVPPGTYLVSVIAETDLLVAEVEAREVSVRDGETATVELTAAHLVHTTVRVTGLPGEAEVRGTLVISERPTSPEIAEGRLDGSGLTIDAPAGPLTATITIAVGPSKIVVARPFTPVAGDAVVEIPFPPGRGAVSGRLASAIARPVRLEDDVARVFTDAAPDGRFTFPLVPAGHYRAIADGFTPAEVDVVDAATSEATLEPLAAPPAPR